MPSSTEGGTAAMLATIADLSATRDDVAELYADLIGTTAAWGEINRAIIERWSMTSLRYIKERAWEIRG